MKNAFKFLLFVLIVFSSCRKEVDDNSIPAKIDSLPDPNDSIIVQAAYCIIGVPDTSIIIMDINPDITVTSWDSPNFYGYDLNADGISDFIFYVSNMNVFGGSVLAISQLRIKTLNNDSYILSDSIYPVVISHNGAILSQSTIDSLFPKVLSLNDTIHLTDNWRNGDLNILTSGYALPPPYGSGDYHYEGAWKDADHKYIGLKYKNLLGWVDIGIPSNKYIKIYEFALSK